MIDQFSIAMLDRGHSPNTVRRRRLTLSRFARHLGGVDDLLTATDFEIDRWLSSLTKASPQSRGHYLGDLARFYGWAKRWRLITTNPTLEMERPSRPKRKPRPISTSDLAMAIEMADPRMRVILLLAAFSGLRVCEIAALDARDVDWDHNVIVVAGKGDKERTVPIHPLVAAELASRREGPIVPSTRGGHLRPITITILVSVHMRGLGIPATAHRLRHWFGTGTYEACRDLRVVQELLGHESPQTTAGYVAASEPRSRAAVAALSLDVAA